MKMVGAAEFKAKCLKLIDDLQKDGEPITITKRGKPVAVLGPSANGSAAREPRSIIGCMKGSVLRYDDPFSPAVDPSEWDVNR